jgi:hypothetical protein
MASGIVEGGRSNIHFENRLWSAQVAVRTGVYIRTGAVRTVVQFKQRTASQPGACRRTLDAFSRSVAYDGWLLRATATACTGAPLKRRTFCGTTDVVHCERDWKESSMHSGPNSVTVRRLRTTGFTQEADELEAWRDAHGNNWGWDGWIRGAHPHVVATIWP